MSDGGMCNVCEKLSRLKCGNCQKVFYCSKVHQKEDWKNHKASCPAFKIVKNKTLGRHLICTRTLTEGEIILKESPMVIGPPQVTPPVCLGCCNLLTELNWKSCSSCGWPMCSEECEKSPHHRPECEITTNYKKTKVKINITRQDLPHPSYQCITVLRCLYLKTHHPDLWSRLMSLESHSFERKSTLKYQSDEFFIANFIPKFFNYLDFLKEEILEVAGIVQVNAHEIPLKDPGFIGIYDEASLFEHSCRANCMKSFTDSGELVIRAAGKILPGDHLSICYTHPLWGRQMRLDHLMETKFFLCQCIRCSDFTEMGTYFNSFKCFRENCPGFATPIIDLESIQNQKKDKPTIKCKSCDQISTQDSLIKEIFDSFTGVNKSDEESCTEFLMKYENFLHPNHHLLTEIKLSLVNLLITRELILLEDNFVDWSVKTCKELYELAITLAPAENRLRGVLLWQLYLALSESERRMAVKKAKQMSQNFQEYKKILSEACKLLKYESTKSPEGKICLQAKKTLENLEKYFRQS